MSESDSQRLPGRTRWNAAMGRFEVLADPTPGPVLGPDGKPTGPANGERCYEVRSPQAAAGPKPCGFGPPPERPAGATGRPYGMFRVAFELFAAESWPTLLPLFANVVVVRAVACGSDPRTIDFIEFTALSHHFELLAAGAQVPFYTLEIEETPEMNLLRFRRVQPVAPPTVLPDPPPESLDPQAPA